MTMPDAGRSSCPIICFSSSFHIIHVELQPTWTQGHRDGPTIGIPIQGPLQVSDSASLTAAATAQLLLHVWICCNASSTVRLQNCPYSFAARRPPLYSSSQETIPACIRPFDQELITSSSGARIPMLFVSVVSPRTQTAAGPREH